MFSLTKTSVAVSATRLRRCALILFMNGMLKSVVAHASSDLSAEEDRSLIKTPVNVNSCFLDINYGHIMDQHFALFLVPIHIHLIRVMPALDGINRIHPQQEAWKKNSDL